VDPIERIERATAFAEDKVAEVKPADMAKPTPCAEFDVKALLNHLIGNLGILATVAKGERAERSEGDQFESDPLSAPGVLDRDWVMPFGTLPGQTMGGIAFIEHLTHGWDVAKATGQDATIPTALVDEAMRVVTPMGDFLRVPGVFGPPLDVPDSASAQDKFVAFTGRMP
jgi:uncharacterized protein (TIGR03086 family)